MSEERLQKVLAAAGIGSRSACEELITSGRVTVDDHVVSELGAKVDPERADIRVDGRPIAAEHFRYIMLHKPAGYLSNPDPRAGYPDWQELVKVPERLYAVGRLDVDSEGLLLLTNDGGLANRLTHPRYEHPKTYLVQVEGFLDPRKLRRMRHGVMLDDGPTAPAQLAWVKETFHLHQVSLGMFVARMRQAISQPTVVGQQEQSLAVNIQPADRVEAFGHFDQLLPVRIAGARVRIGEIPGRLMEHDIAKVLGGNRPAVHPDIGSLWVHLCAQLAHHMVVNSHPPGGDQSFTRTPRADAGCGQYFLQTFFRHEPTSSMAPARPSAAHAPGYCHPVSATGCRPVDYQ